MYRCKLKYDEHCNSKKYFCIGHKIDIKQLIGIKFKVEISSMAA